MSLVDTRKITHHGHEHHQNLRDKDYSKVPVHKLKALKLKGGLPAYDNMYTEALKRTVQGLYKSDFDLRHRVLKK